MDRRQFQQGLVCATTLFASPWCAWAQNKGPQPPAHVWLPGLHSLLEMVSRRALERAPNGWMPALPQHLRDAWDNWMRFGPPD